jgi:polyisoprenoid-binding protein YceI
MTAHYKFDPTQSRFRVQAFATGLLSFAGHSPTFAVHDFRGHLDLDSSKVVAIELTARAEGLELLGNFGATDRREIEIRMRRDVLQTSAYPEVMFEAADAPAAPIAPGRYRIQLDGRLSLHGVTNRHRMIAELQVLDDAIRLLGDCPLHISEYRISPVTALGGTIKLKDELAVHFDIIGLREAS